MTKDSQTQAAEIADLKIKLGNSILAKATVDKINLEMSQAHNDVVEENNGLKCQVELLRWAAEHFDDVDKCEDILSKTPRQCLAGSNADAVGNAMQKFKYDYEGPRDNDSIEAFFDEIENQIREAANGKN